jgi:hypothetical protein
MKYLEFPKNDKSFKCNSARKKPFAPIFYQKVQGMSSPKSREQKRYSSGHEMSKGAGHGLT